jgi:hypothetical protein
MVPNCPHCAGPLVTISFNLEGDPLVMRSCSRCDLRFCVRDGDDTDLVDLLGREPLRQPALR